MSIERDEPDHPHAAPKAEIEAPIDRRTWARRFRFGPRLGWALALVHSPIALFISTMNVACNCEIGDAKARVMLIVNGLIILRILVAVVFKQRSWSWPIYAIAPYALASLTEAIAGMLGEDH
jgi:hypothetical protein